MILSVITINYNNAEGLNRTIQSIDTQTWKEFEYIVIDGASNDGSIDVIKRFESIIDLWISEPDTGVFNAMNKGIKKAKGDYLLFLNSGDFLVDKDVLKNVFSEEYNEDILCGRCLVSDKGKSVFTTNPPDNFQLSHFYKATIAHQATFIKRSLFDRFGLYREDLKLMSDWEFWIRTIILGNVTTKKIDIIVSDFNLDGISSDKKNNKLNSIETSKVFSDLNLQNIIPDYQYWENEREEMKIMYWVKSKILLYKPLLVIYYIAVKLNFFKKNESKT
jgi:glycosyltransferase involved in cell wall biosynthesis